jgi:hypothetical protein
MTSVKHILTVLASGLMALVLAGCTSFAPVYGDMSDTGIAAARFNFTAPDTRLEQLVRNRLQSAFPNPATLLDPVLTVSVRTAGVSGILSDVYDINEPVGRRVEATVTITRGEETLFTATRFVDTSYQSGRLELGNGLASAGAQEVAARSVAEALRAAILAGYRPSPPPLSAQ